jgi:hypothetical protein
VHKVSDVRQMGIHTSDSLVTGPSYFDVEIAFEKFKSFKSPRGNNTF